MKIRTNKLVKDKILYCGKECNCICHQEGYPLPKDFWNLFMGMEVKTPHNIKLSRKGKLIIKQKKN